MALVVLWPALGFAQFDAYEGDPIRYSSAPTDDPVARLQRRLDEGQARLQFDGEHGYLSSVLRELGISASSQVLVFSKTSFQRDRISPSTPRALYFSDNVYIGWVRHGEVVEVAAMDPRQGTIFYTLAQEKKERPRFERQSAECLQCHASSLTKGVPGLLVRSVYPASDGLPVLKAGSFSTDQSTPLENRWGGWYVTGTHGAARHMGNSILDGAEDPSRFDTAAGANLTDLRDRFETDAYLSPHSDIAALMLFAHQVEAHNLITSAGYQARLALHVAEAMNGMDGAPPDRITDSTRRRFEYAAKPLLKCLLFAGEARLEAPIRGTSRFAEEFARRGPRDRRGRSLYDLDLTRRLLRHPLSPLIYSEAFDRFPDAFKDDLFRRLWEVLARKDTSPDFAGLSPEDRQAILEILIDTMKGLPESWKTGGISRERNESGSRIKTAEF